MNYCISAAWHGGDQPVALLRCNEAQVALIAAFRSTALLGLVCLIFHLTLGSGQASLLANQAQFCQQPYHPVAQDRFLTEAKQG